MSATVRPAQREKAGVRTWPTRDVVDAHQAQAERDRQASRTATAIFTVLTVTLLAFLYVGETTRWTGAMSVWAFLHTIAASIAFHVMRLATMQAQHSGRRAELLHHTHCPS